MSRVTVRIKGLDQAKANIQQVLQNVEDGSEAALDVTAAATLADDKDGCPVDTGYLRDNQQIFAARLDRQIGSNVPYHIFVHEGTYKMGARPFTTNAFESNKNTLISECSVIKVI